MSTITSTFTPGYNAKTGRDAAAAASTPRRGRFARLVARLIEARQRQVERELHRHGLHLPTELEAAGWKINERNEDSLPFVR